MKYYCRCNGKHETVAEEREESKATGLSTTSNSEYVLGHLIGNIGLKFVKL